MAFPRLSGPKDDALATNFSDLASESGSLDITLPLSLGQAKITQQTFISFLSLRNRVSFGAATLADLETNSKASLCGRPSRK